MGIQKTLIVLKIACESNTVIYIYTSKKVDIHYSRNEKWYETNQVSKIEINYPGNKSEEKENKVIKK